LLSAEKPHSSSMIIARIACWQLKYFVDGATALNP